VDLDDRKIDLGMVDGPLRSAEGAPEAQDAAPRRKPASREGARRKRKPR